MTAIESQGFMYPESSPGPILILYKGCPSVRASDSFQELTFVQPEPRSEDRLY
jgi:hypothetical protein